ncbi:MAG: hypothetical protein POELPBGB_01819 [Bacteroidia bacterium]|nr:hypothetical protein [Bacteroidia bacterium]
MSMNFLRKYFSVAMALLMLVMSIGITAHKMVCLVSGAVTLSFIESEDCCAKESKAANAVQAKCCDYSSDYFKLDIQTIVSNFNIKFDFVDYFFTLPVFVFTEVAQAQPSEAAHAPPLISGKDILILVSVFRI